ncbi:MAG: HNH endonuclease, partial [Clostridia bacterium]|nr:HNH endonuclease [Clostridia bacterium]
MKTTDEGYINKNNQKNLGYRGPSETHISAKFYEMECLDCGHKYMANGCDVWLRKCPKCCVTKKNITQKSKSRVIPDKLRYKVLKRDNFKCCACGASPAKDPSVELHIDHIVPWS